MCAVSGILVYFFVKEINKERSKEGQIWDNYRFVFKNQRLKYALLLLVISAAAIYMIQPLFALFIENKVGQTAYLATITGSIFGVVGLFQVISSSLWGKLNDRREIRKNLAWALVGAGIGYALHVVTTGVWELVPIRALLGLCIGGVMPSLFSFINKCIPAHKKGGVMGIASSFTMFGNLLGPISSGFIASVTSIDFMFILSGIILASSALLAYYKLKESPKDIHNLSAKDKSKIEEEIAAGVLD
jgi:DHA1 family multidrug resistance protein-like MFS transporter